MDVLKVTGCSITQFVLLNGTLVGFYMNITTLDGKSTEPVGLATAFSQPFVDLLTSPTAPVSFNIVKQNDMPYYALKNGAIISGSTVMNMAKTKPELVVDANKLKIENKEHYLYFGNQYAEYKNMAHTVAETEKVQKPNVVKKEEPQQPVNQTPQPQAPQQNQEQQTQQPAQQPAQQQTQQPAQQQPQQPAQTTNDGVLTLQQQAQNLLNLPIASASERESCFRYSDDPSLAVGDSGIHSKYDPNIVLPTIVECKEGIFLYGKNKETEENIVALKRMMGMLKTIGNTYLTKDELDYVDMTTSMLDDSDPRSRYVTDDGTIDYEKIKDPRLAQRLSQASATVGQLTKIYMDFEDFVGRARLEKRNSQVLCKEFEEAIKTNGTFNFGDYSFDVKTMKILRKDGSLVGKENIIHERAKLKAEGKSPTMSYVNREVKNTPPTPSFNPSDYAQQTQQQSVQVPTPQQQVPTPQQQVPTPQHTTPVQNKVILHAVEMISIDKGKTVQGLIFTANGMLGTTQINKLCAHSLTYIEEFFKKKPNTFEFDNIDTKLFGGKLKFNLDGIKLTDLTDDINQKYIHPSRVNCTGLFKGDTELERLKKYPIIEADEAEGFVAQTQTTAQPTEQPKVESVSSNPSQTQQQTPQTTQATQTAQATQTTQTPQQFKLNPDIAKKLASVNWKELNDCRPLRLSDNPTIYLGFMHDNNGIQEQTNIPLEDIVTALAYLSSQLNK